MSVEFVHVVVEEPSAEAALSILLPKLLREIPFAIHAHEGKDDLLKKLPARLRAWSHWIPETYRILVLVDRDSDDCRRLKEQLEQAAKDANLATRSDRKKGLYQVVNRLAIEELEAWYFGDWQAVRRAYPRVPANVASQAQYRDPDAIRGGTCQAFERVLRKGRYFEGGLRKIEAAREIAPHMIPDRNASTSFIAFREAVKEWVA